MEPRGCERHGWAKPRGRNGRERMSQRGQQTSFNGASGMSDIEGKAARVAASKRGQRASFKSLLILIRSGDMCRSVRFILIRTKDQARASCGARHRAIERVK
jgi:hypothetical protein